MTLWYFVCGVENSSQSRFHISVTKSEWNLLFTLLSSCIKMKSFQNEISYMFPNLKLLK